MWTQVLLLLVSVAFAYGEQTCTVSSLDTYSYSYTYTTTVCTDYCCGSSGSQYCCSDCSLATSSGTLCPWQIALIVVGCIILVLIITLPIVFCVCVRPTAVVTSYPATYSTGYVTAYPVTTTTMVSYPATTTVVQQYPTAVAAQQPYYGTAVPPAPPTYTAANAQTNAPATK